MAKHLTDEEKFEEGISKLNLTPKDEFVIRQTNETNILFKKILGEIRRHWG